MRARKTLGGKSIAALGLAGLLLTNPALAQTPPEPAPPPGMPNTADPPAESTPAPDAKGETAQPDKPLSEQLKQNEGVLEPPRDLDSKIERPAPVPDPNTTPVIPPPGSPGGDPNIQPK
jgi:hypothetical protein